MSRDLLRATQAVEDLLEALGVPDHPHMAETPVRVAKAWGEALSGYDEDPADHLERTFDAPDNPGIVVVSGIRVESTCAHHLLPIRGIATVAYLPVPGHKIVGLSKLARLVEGYSRRLQVQEQIGSDVVAALEERLYPRAAGCVITAEHGCMTHRGVGQAGTRTTTAAWSGPWYAAGRNSDVLAEHRASLAAAYR